MNCIQQRERREVAVLRQGMWGVARKFVAGSLVSWVMVGPAFGAGETVTIPVEDYHAIMHRLDALQQRVEFLEAKPVAAPVDETKVHKVEQDVQAIYDGMDEIETRQLQQKINLGAELRTRIDSYTLSDYPLVGDKERDSNNWTSRFRVNMDAAFTETLSFHGRLAMYKNWGDSDDGTGGGMINDANRSHQPSSSNLWVDRAYVDWTPQGLPIPLAITVGRHPSTEGPPFEFKENRLRQSTYPAHLFNGESDGIVATLGLERYTGLAGSGLRLGYSKLYHSDDDTTFGKAFPFLDDQDVEDSNVLGVFLESGLPGLSDSLAVLSYANVSDLPLIPFSPALCGLTGITELPANVDLGDMQVWGALIQARNVADSGTDLFFSYGANHTRPNGNASMGYGLLSPDGREDRDGFSIYSGARYTLPFAPLNLPKVGFEFNYGSQYWFSMTMGSSDLFNKLATRGEVYDLYYIQPVNQHLFFRAGWMHVVYEYSGSGMYMGEPAPTQALLDNYYLLMDVRF
jgi:hypothetical protein